MKQQTSSKVNQTDQNESESNGKIEPLTLEKKLFNRRVVGFLIVVQLVVTSMYAINLPVGFRSFLFEDTRRALKTTFPISSDAMPTEGANKDEAFISLREAEGESIRGDLITYSLFLILPVLIMIYILVGWLDNIIEEAIILPKKLCELERLSLPQAKGDQNKGFLPFLLNNLYRWTRGKIGVVGGVLLLMVVLPAFSGFYQDGIHVLRNERSYLHLIERIAISAEITNIAEQVIATEGLEHWNRLLTDRTYLEESLDGEQEDLAQISQLLERAGDYEDRIYTPPFWLRLAYLLWIGFTNILMPITVAAITGLGIWYLFALRTSFRKMVPDYYELNIEPSHRDRAGGLARLGNMYLKIIGLFVIPLIFLGFLARFRGLFDEWGPLFDIVVVVGFVLIFLPMIWIGELIYDTSQEMRKKRGKHYDDLAREVEKISKRLNKLIKKKAGIEKPGEGNSKSAHESQSKTADSVQPAGTNLWQWLIQLFGLKKLAGSQTKALKIDDEIKNYKACLEAIEKVYPADKRYPVLPFNLSFLAGITAAQLLSILWVLFGLRGNEHFQNLLALLFGIE